MQGISCEQRNKQTKKVVANCRFSRIPEMIYFRAGFRMANRCKGFFWPFLSKLAVSLPTRGLDSCCSPHPLPLFLNFQDSISQQDMFEKICLIRRKFARRMMPYYHILFILLTFHSTRQEDRILNLAQPALNLPELWRKCWAFHSPQMVIRMKAFSGRRSKIISDVQVLEIIQQGCSMECETFPRSNQFVQAGLSVNYMKRKARNHFYKLQPFLKTSKKR